MFYLYISNQSAADLSLHRNGAQGKNIRACAYLLPHQQHTISDPDVSILFLQCSQLPHGLCLDTIRLMQNNKTIMIKSFFTVKIRTHVDATETRGNGDISDTEGNQVNELSSLIATWPTYCNNPCQTSFAHSIYKYLDLL